MKNSSLLKTLAIILASMSCALSASAYDIMYDDMYFNIIGDHEVEVTYKDTNYSSYSGDVVIPQWVSQDGVEYDVVAIGPDAFRDCTGLLYLSIYPSVKRIYGSPFVGCSSLFGLYIHDLQAWCEMDFMGNAGNNPLQICHRLFLDGQPVIDLVIPEGTTRINSMAFHSCSSITSVTIPSSVTAIEWGSFAKCTNLKTVNIGSGVTRISNNAFSYSSSIETIICDAETPPVIGGEDAFAPETYSNASLKVPESSLSAYQTADYWRNFSNISAKLFDFYEAGIYYKRHSVGEVMVVRGDAAGNSYSGRVVIPETVCHDGMYYLVTRINSNAFTACPDLNHVTVPAGVVTIYNAFYNSGATLLTDITCLAIEPPYGMREMTADQYANISISVPKNSVAAYQADEGWGQFATINAMTYDMEYSGLYFDILDDGGLSVTRKDNNSYTGTYGVIVPEIVTYGGRNYTVTAISSNAFANCNLLSNVTLPSTVKTIGNSAFRYCSNLSTINLESVDTIGSYSFGNCTSLTGARLNGALQSIQGTSFAYCTSLTGFTHSMVEDGPWLVYDFVNGVIFTRGANNRTLVAYPCGRMSANYTVPDGTVIIGANAFVGNSRLQTVNMPTSLRTIAQRAFYGCTKITFFEVPKGVVTIDDFAFSRCSALQGVMLPSTLTSLGGAAFHEDAALVAIACKAKTPPACGTALSFLPFDSSHFSSATLAVRPGGKRRYEQTYVWQNFTNIIESDALIEVETEPGDVNGDGNINVSDVAALINLLLSGAAPTDGADVNQDGSVNVSDVAALISYLLSN